MPYLSDTLSPLPTAQNRPCDAAGVLALQEQRLGLAVLEAEDLAVGPDEELALDMALACPNVGVIQSSVEALHSISCRRTWRWQPGLARPMEHRFLNPIVHTWSTATLVYRGCSLILPHAVAASAMSPRCRPFRCNISGRRTLPG